MDKVIREMYFMFCADESAPYIQTKYDKKESALYNKLEKTLNSEQIGNLEEYVDAIFQNVQNLKMQVFEQGIKIGIRLSSGQINTLNL